MIVVSDRVGNLWCSDRHCFERPKRCLMHALHINKFDRLHAGGVVAMLANQEKGASPSLTSNSRHASVREPLLLRRTENTTTLWARYPETPSVAQLASDLLAPPSGRHRSARKKTYAAWRQPLVHHARRDSQTNQFLLPPAEESASPHASTSRNTSDRAKIGLTRCALRNS